MPEKTKKTRYRVFLEAMTTPIERKAKNTKNSKNTYNEIIYGSFSINFYFDAKSCSTSTIDYIIVARLRLKKLTS